MLPGIDSPRTTCTLQESEPGLRVTRRLGKATKTRKTYLISGVNPKTGFLAYNSTITGMERAIVERLFYIQENGIWTTPPVPVPQLFNKNLELFKKRLLKMSKRAHPLSHSDFAMCYHGPRRERYLKAATSLEELRVRRKDSYLKFFMKFETYDTIEKPNPSPRGINPRDDRYLCSLGAYLHPIEKKVYRNIARVFGYDVVMKGYNQQDRGRILSQYWSEVEDCVSISIDASRFEQSVGETALKFEHDVYKSFFKGDPLLAALLSWQIKNRGSASAPDGHLVYELIGRRMSGDKNTALGNCLLSSALGYSFMLSLGLESSRYRFFCDGDDAVLFVSRKHLEKVKENLVPWFRGMGFRMKVEKTAIMLEQVDFCQSRPVWFPDGYVMIREPYRGLSKDAVSKKPLDSVKNYERWIAAVGRGGLSTAGGCPVSQSYYQCLIRNSHGAKALAEKDPSLKDFFKYKIQGMDRKYSEVHPASRASFSLAFGISPQAQRIYESYYDRLSLVYGLREVDLLPVANCGW